MQILFQFDVRTVALFVAMTFFVQATAIGAQAYLIRELQQYRGVGAVLLANLCVAVGLMLRLFGDRLPELLNSILPNALVLAGLGLFYIALSQFTGLPYSKAYVIGVITVVVSFLSYFTYWDDDIGKRIIILSLGSVSMAGVLIYQLWQTQKDSLRLSANLMLVSFLVYGTFMIVRAISIMLDPPQESASFTPAQSATYLLSLAISFFWSTGFLLMVSQRLRNDLVELATIDALTRIPNRRATEGFLEKELSRARRTDSEFSLLLIDIDDFKQVNDRWGHAVGDHVLARTAGILQAMLRKEDWVGRWGGEEFLVIVPGSPNCNPEALAERLRCEVARSEYSQAATSFHVTVSIGVACADRNILMDEVLKQADDALYRAKITKNTISIAKKD